MTDREKAVKGLDEAWEYMRDKVKDIGSRKARMMHRIVAASNLLKEQEAEIETEGGGSSWWHVCGECRGPVDTQDRYCRHCGSKLKQ